MIIVTGADGFIGGHLVPLLLKKFKKSELLCLVGNGRSQLANRGKKLLKKHKIKTLKVDLLSEKDLLNLPKYPDIVIHLAANTDTSTKDHRVNDQGTRNLFNSLELSTKTHFIYTSTTMVFSGRKDANKPITDKTPTAPTSEYARTKLKAEEFLKSECVKNKIPLTILRLNTVYGDDPRKHKMFVSLKNLVLKKSFFCRLNWPGLTSLIHVEDVALIISRITKKPPVPGKLQIFLVYTESFNLARISQLMHQALSKKYNPIPLPDFFWKICKTIRNFIPWFENFLPGKVYNAIWRAGIIADNVIYCKSERIFKIFPGCKPRKLENTIEDTLA